MVKEIQLLRQRDILPSQRVVHEALGTDLIPAFERFMHGITQLGLQCNWHYYNDGKAWLGKVTHKAKTVLWLSVWEGFFQTGFYFTAATGGGIASLEIDPLLKAAFLAGKPVGRLRPLVVKVRGMQQVGDVLALARYKKDL